MFKILKEGGKVIKHKFIFKDTCDECGAEYEFEIEDCTSIDKCINGYATWKCPCCGNKRVEKRNKMTYRTEIIELGE